MTKTLRFIPQSRANNCINNKAMEYHKTVNFTKDKDLQKKISNKYSLPIDETDYLEYFYIDKENAVGDIIREME